MSKQLFICGFMPDLRSRYWFLIKLIFLITAFLLCGSLDTPAQKIRKHKKISSGIVKQNIPPKTEKTEPNINGTNLPVSVVNPTETDYLSGEASVAVNPKQPTVIRLGLAQNAVSVVEFPASDGVYYIHEGNPKLVSVFQSPTRIADRSVTIYPGEGFVTGNKEAQAAITLQMRSGLILILEFVPVSNIRSNAHRCVINYDREEVVSARRAAGLAFNLGEDIKPAITKKTRANSKLVSPETEESLENTEENTGQEEVIPVKSTQTEVTRGKLARKENENKQVIPKTGLELARMVNRRLADCLKDPAKSLGAWSPNNNNLSLAVSAVTEIDAAQRLVIIAVRNNSTNNLRLVPGTPELQLLTGDEKGNPLSIERLNLSHVETTSSEGLILPGSVSYYAIVYNAPMMGAGQRLSVLVSHREAADSPARALISSVNQAKD